jgi:hypothetical protein
MLQPMKLTIATAEREFCERANWLRADLMVRDNLLGQVGHLSRGGRGPSAPAATWHDGAVMALGLISSRKAKDVVEGFKRTSSLRLANASMKKQGEDRREVEPIMVKGTPLLKALEHLFEQCAVSPMFRLLGLSVTLSDVQTIGVLMIGEYDGASEYDGAIAEGNLKKTYTLRFEGDPAPPGHQPAAIEHSSFIRAHALMTLIELISVNMLPQRETGPSAVTDEPGSISRDNLIDRHRATTRKRQKRA